MKENKDIFDLFKKSEQKMEVTPTRHAWDKLEHKLDARQNSHQTSWYRSLAMAAAVVALVAVASVITLLNTNKDSNFAMSKEAASKPYLVEELSMENTGGSDANDIIAFNRKVEAHQVATKEGNIQKKLKPITNKGKSASNKIITFKNEELAGNIDLASNTYSTQSAPLERKVRLGQVTINKNTTKAEVEQKALGKVAETKITATTIPANSTVIPGAKKVYELADVAEEEEISNTSWAAADKVASSAPTFQVTEMNMPKAEADVVVGNDDQSQYEMSMEDIGPADRRLEEHIAASTQKRAKKKRNRDIFGKKEKSRSMMPDTRSVGIASSATSNQNRQTAAEMADHQFQLFSWMIGKWSDETNNIEKEWVAQEDRLGMKFKSPKGANGDREITHAFIISAATVTFVDARANRVYPMNDMVDNVYIFKFDGEDETYWAEIVQMQNYEFTISTYRTIVGDGETGKQKLEKMDLKTTLYRRQ